jgi:hypothetical protein
MWHCQILCCDLCLGRTAQSSPVSIQRHVAASPLLADNHKTGTNFTVYQWRRVLSWPTKMFADLTSKLRPMLPPYRVECSCFLTKQSNPSVYLTTLMLEGEDASKMSIHFYQITRCHGPGGSSMHRYNPKRPTPLRIIPDKLIVAQLIKKYVSKGAAQSV